MSQAQQAVYFKILSLPNSLKFLYFCTHWPLYNSHAPIGLRSASIILILLPVHMPTAPDWPNER